jgi:hypothetical protein
MEGVLDQDGAPVASLRDDRRGDQHHATVSSAQRQALHRHASHYLRGALHGASAPGLGRRVLEGVTEHAGPAELVRLMHGPDPNSPVNEAVSAAPDTRVALEQLAGSATEIARILRENPASAVELIGPLMRVSEEVCAGKPDCSWRAMMSTLDGGMVHAFVRSTMEATPAERAKTLERYAAVLADLAGRLEGRAGGLTPEQRADLEVRQHRLLLQPHSQYPEVATLEADCEDCERDEELVPYGPGYEEDTAELARRRAEGAFAYEGQPRAVQRVGFSRDRIMDTLRGIAGPR